MDLGRRNTKRYNFRLPRVEKIQDLASLVKSLVDFRKLYGKLLSILSTSVNLGLLKTWVQFYDPVYRCFTFPDYQLMPTLEEYADLSGIQVSDREPFNGLEAIPKSYLVATITYLEKSEIDDKVTTKGGLLVNI